MNKAKILLMVSTLLALAYLPVLVGLLYTGFKFGLHPMVSAIIAVVITVIFAKFSTKYIGSYAARFE